MKLIEVKSVELQEDLIEQLDARIASDPDPAGNLIRILHDAQELFGYLPPALQLHIAQKSGVSAAHVNGIVTFYSFFSEEPKGEYNISVCLGTACFVKGAGKVLEEFEKQLGLNQNKRITDDRLFAISEVRCIGACGLAPVVRINDKIYGHMTPDMVAGVIAACREEAKERVEE